MKSSITFLHTADIHLGATFLSLGSKGNRQRAQLRATFGNVITKAVENEVDFVILAGDTFDSNKPSPESIKVFKNGVEQLNQAKIPLIIIGGTHDYLDNESVLTKLKDSLQDKIILLDDHTRYYNLSGLSTTVYGISLKSSNHPINPVNELVKIDKQSMDWQIGVVHGALDIGKNQSLEAHFTSEDISRCQMDYLALGHWHNTNDYSKDQTCCWYPGSPEMIALDEKEKGNVLIVTLTPDTKPKVVIEPVGVRYKQQYTFDLSEQSIEELLEKMEENTDLESVLELTVNGNLSPEKAIDNKALKNKLEEYFFAVRIIDKTHMIIDEQVLAQFDEKTVIGRYIRLLQDEINNSDKDKKRKLEQALQFGVALMLGKEVQLWS